MAIFHRKSCALFAWMAMAAMVPASLSYADDIVISYAPAGTQAPNATILCGVDPGCWIGEQSFSTQTVPAAGAFPTLESVGGLTGAISGSYSGGLVMYAANQYGGAEGTGYYPELFSTGGSYSLTLTTSGNLPGVNYFGLWFSALDAGNQLQFYENGTLLLTFTPAMFQALVGACPNSSNAFCGNPNADFSDQDSGEQFAFLNFFDQNGYFNDIVFTETGGGGLESDNQTVAYMDPPTPSGTIISDAPEPGSLTLLWMGTLAMAGVRRRSLRTKTRSRSTAVGKSLA